MLDKIQYDLRYTVNTKKQPLVIFLHGFKGYKDWGFIPYICTRIAENSMIAINMNFTNTGMIDIENKIYDADVFSQTTISQEINDVIDLIGFLKNDALMSKIHNGEVYLIGHSLGGAISVMVANKISSIKKVILLGAISRFDRYTTRQKELWKKYGKVESKISDTKQLIWLNDTFLYDVEDNYSANIIPQTVKNLEIPMLIIHGMEDLTVKPIEAHENYKAAKKGELIIVEKTGHTFGIKNKFIEPTKAIIETTQKTLNFLNKNN